MMYAIGQFAFGLAGELLASSKVLLVSGMYAVSVAGALFALCGALGVQSAAPYALLRLLDGFVQASGWSQSLSIWSSWFPLTGRGTMLGVWASNSNVGDIIGLNLAGGITGQGEHGGGGGDSGGGGSSWVTVIFTSSLLMCAMATANLFFLKGAPPAEIAADSDGEDAKAAAPAAAA